MTLAPNIVLVLVDNLGWGELGCYGGGSLRGAPTPRIDALAHEGLLLQNFNVESDCVPTRSALLTGRHPIRTGGIQSIPAGLPQGIHPWEVTLQQLLSAKGYGTAIFGKWHLGDTPGRFPHQRGFDEWYGIPRTSNEAMFTSTPDFDPSVVAMPMIMEGKKGEPAREVAVYDLEARRRIDSDIVDRANDYMRRQAKSGRPFFAYIPLTQVHLPTLPHRDFVGSTGIGDFADAMVEMDHNVGRLLDNVAALGLRDNTLFIFASDNGPEFKRPYRGTAGPFVGTYHTAMEGGLRAPCILRWAGRIPKNRVSNEMVHVVDLFTTLARIGGAEPPSDRPIDGLDMGDFLLGKSEKSPREGFVFYIKTEPRAAKWRNYKMHFVWEREPNDGPKKLEQPYLFNILQDPKEECDLNNSASWVRGPIRRMVNAFQATLKEWPPIPPGAPDSYKPGRQTSAPH